MVSHADEIPPRPRPPQPPATAAPRATTPSAPPGPSPPGRPSSSRVFHTGLPVIHHTLRQWWAIDAPPFQAAIRAGVDEIMIGHIEVPALDDSGQPVSLSRRIVTGLLRDRLGYQGVVVTDSLQMAGVRWRATPTAACR
jgi:beta-N-acetylhexosaminidase